MQTYVAVKSIVMALALIGAFGYFFIRARHLYRLMRSVKGQTDFKLDRIGEKRKVKAVCRVLSANVAFSPVRISENRRKHGKADLEEYLLPHLQSVARSFAG